MSSRPQGFSSHRGCSNMLVQHFGGFMAILNIGLICLTWWLLLWVSTEGSTESSPLLFGVETVIWPRAAKKSGKWYRGASKRQTVSWRGGTGTRRREAGCATQLRTPRATTRGGRGDGAAILTHATKAQNKLYIGLLGIGSTSS